LNAGIVLEYVKAATYVVYFASFKTSNPSRGAFIRELVGPRIPKRAAPGGILEEER